MNIRVFTGLLSGAFVGALMAPVDAHAGLEGIARTPILLGVISTVAYSAIGLIMAFIAFKVIDLLTPGNLAKEITENKNIALSMLVSSMMIGVSIIIAGVMVG